MARPTTTFQAGLDQRKPDYGGWVEKDSQDNSAATATRAAESGKRHIITGYAASYSASVTGALLEIKDGSTVIYEAYIYDTGGQVFPPQGIEATEGNAVSAVLAASGGAGKIGKVALMGYTV